MSHNDSIDDSPMRLVKRYLGVLALVAVFNTTPQLGAAESADSAIDLAFRGQSRFLALAAEQALAQWQSDKAILLALNALPGAYGGDRPLVPAARMALHRAVHQSAAFKKVVVEQEPLFAVVSPGSAYLAVVPKDAEVIEVFQVSSGQRVLRVEHDSAVWHAAFSEDDRILATLGDDGLRLWDMAARNKIAHYDSRDHGTSPKADPKDYENQPLSMLFESLSNQQSDLPQMRGTTNRHQQLPLVAFSRDSTKVAFASDRSGLEIRRISDGRLLQAVDVNPKFLYFADDGSRIMVLDRANDGFVAVDVTTGEIAKLADDVIMSKALNSAEGMTLTGVENGHLILFDAAGERYAEIKTPGFLPASKEDVDPSGSLRSGTSVAMGKGLVAGGTSAGVLVWDLEKKTQLEHFRGGKITSLAVSPNGGYLVAGTPDGEVRLWDADAFGSKWVEVKTWELPSHADRVVYVGFAGNGEYVVSLAADRSLNFRKLRARKIELEGWLPDRNTAVLSRDGRLVAKYDDRFNTLNVWDTRTGASLAAIHRMIRPLGRNSFHPDSEHLLISSRFSKVLDEEQPGAQILDLATGEPSAGTKGRPASVHRSVYTMAGQRIITAATGNEPSLSIWNVEDGRLLRHVQGERLVASSWLGSQLLTRSGQDLILHDLDNNTSITLTSVPLDTAVDALTADFDEHGTRLLIREGTALELWDTATRRVIDSFSASVPPTHLGLNADGSRWFAVVDGSLMVREGGVILDQIEVDDKNLLFALIDRRIVTLNLKGSLIDLGFSEKISVEEAIARLPAGRSCLTPDERQAYDLPILSDTQREERRCSQ
jgi:WD40 repeat protein